MAWNKVFRSSWVILFTLMILAPQASLSLAQELGQEEDQPRLGLQATAQFADEQPPITSNASLQPIAPSSGLTLAPRLSWSRMVFETYRDNNYEIYTAKDDGSELKRLTNHATADIHPRLNRGGSMVAFSTKRNGNYDIYTIRPDATGLTRLTTDARDDVYPAWSPDGTRIAFQSYRNGHAEVYVMNANGSNQTRLTMDSSGYNGEPCWSPDGSKIAFTSYRNQGWRIWVMNANGSNQRQLSSNTFSENPSWSPDGSQIAFDGQADGYWGQDIMVMNADGSNERMLYAPGQTSYTRDGLVASWSPDGLNINYTDISYVYDPNNDAWYWTDAFLMTFSISIQPVTPQHLFGTNLDRQPDWQSLDTTVPTSIIQAMPAFSLAPITVSWSGVDPGGSGIKTYDVQYKDGMAGNWVDWLPATTLTSENFPGEGAHTYYFRVRAVDHALNLEPWNQDPLGDAFTTLYAFRASGIIWDNSGVSIDGATVATNPTPFIGGSSNAEGKYELYIASGDGPVTMNWSKTGYGSPPETAAEMPGSANIAVVLPPADNLIENSNMAFPGSAEFPWITSGVVPQSGILIGHTGNKSYRLGEPADQANPLKIKAPGSTGEPFGLQIATEPGGIVHAVWGENLPEFVRMYYYAWRDLEGSWSDPEIIVPGDDMTGVGAPIITLDTNNNIHVIYSINSFIYHRFKPSNGSWSDPEIISDDQEKMMITMDTGADGSLHIAWAVRDSYFSDIFYTYRNASGVWSDPVNIDKDQPYRGGGIEAFEIDAAGLPHILWNAWPGQIIYTYMQSNHNWAPQERISATTSTSDFVIGADGKVYLVYVAYDEYTDNVFFTWRDPISGIWSTPLRLFHALDHNAVHPKILLDKYGELQVLWIDAGDSGHAHLGVGPVYYRSRTPGGLWSNPTKLYEDAAGSLVATLDQEGYVRASWQDGEGFFYAKQSITGWEEPLKIGQIIPGMSQLVKSSQISTEDPAQIFTDNRGDYHIRFGPWYLTNNRLSSDGEASLELPLDLPGIITTPVLSFFYQTDELTVENGGRFDVQIDGGNETSIAFTTNQNQSTWSHQWIDLSRWAGQSIHVRFLLSLKAGELLGSTLLDDVTVGSANPDLWINTDACGDSLPGQNCPISITYGNRGVASATNVVITATLPQDLTFIESDIPPSHSDGQILMWDFSSLEGKSSPLTIHIMVRVEESVPMNTILSGGFEIITSTTELEKNNNTAPLRVRVGKFLYLPILRK